MNRQHLFTLSAVLLVTSLFAACANDGTLAGKGKPVDVPATVSASCAQVAAADAQFQAFAKLHPNVIDANGMNTEGGAVATVYDRDKNGLLTPKAGGVCDPTIKPNLAAAEATLLTAGFQIANLLATWQK